MILTFGKMGFLQLPPLGWPWGRFRGWIHSSNFFSGIQRAQARLCTTTRSRLMGGFWVGGGSQFLRSTFFCFLRPPTGSYPAAFGFIRYIRPWATLPLGSDAHKSPIWTPFDPKMGKIRLSYLILWLLINFLRLPKGSYPAVFRFLWYIGPRATLPLGLHAH